MTANRPYPQNFLATPTAPAFRNAIAPFQPSHQEIVRLHLIGSQRGIAIIQNQLHLCGFAEVNTWSRPQPTGKPGEYISVLIRRLGVRS
ncbi:MAG: peptide ABC transporter substrate-binding protein [Spirulinaceae cyanobacterium SM2_1_0]|nr:peptide ABC transporter substrate-binding protein [Spirulinaceae cyanobacterium SM2_1_0]